MAPFKMCLSTYFNFIAVFIFISLLQAHSTNPLSTDELRKEMLVEKNHVRIVPDISKRRSNRMDQGKAADSEAGDRLDIYCHSGLRNKDLWRIWTSYTLKIGVLAENYPLYVGPNETDVYRQHREAARSWFFQQFMPWRADSVTLAVFNKTCVGISTKDSYYVILLQKAVDPWLVGYLIAGVILFFMAKRLSRNLMFYYGTGIGFGLIASLLILVFIMSRFMPKKYGAAAILVGGWSITLWLIQYVWENIQKILDDYIEYVAGYFAIAGIISFAILYYKGPVTNPRMINLIKWSLQVIALVFVYNGTQIQEVSITFIVLLLAFQLVKVPSLMPKSYTFWWRWLPRFVPRPRLLTEKEFMKEGREETTRALEDLKAYCRSPDCDAWKTMSRLQSPQRFAQWVEGGAHLSEDELFTFDSEPGQLNFDDSNESEMSFRLSAP